MKIINTEGKTYYEDSQENLELVSQMDKHHLINVLQLAIKLNFNHVAKVLEDEIIYRLKKHSKLLIPMHNMFEEYLEEVHAKEYAGTDDDMPEKYNQWLEDLDKQELINYAQKWGNLLINKQ
jgi:restriction endonuclease